MQEQIGTQNGEGFLGVSSKEMIPYVGLVINENWFSGKNCLTRLT